MRISAIAFFIFLISISVGCISATNRETENRDDFSTDDFSWNQTEDDVSLLNNGETVWRFNFNKNEDKPYFYPLCALNGVNIALERPQDHPWHRGLWFSWKYINGVNYWEEDPATGLAPGRSKIVEVEPLLNEDFSAEFRVMLEYLPEGEDVAVMTGNWTLSVRKPKANDQYLIDWDLLFTAPDEDLILDRTVPARHGGESWGGYAGFSIRANLHEMGSIIYTASDGWINDEDLTGYRDSIRWMDMSGKSVKKEGNESAGITFFDHPENPRFPSTWYVWFGRDAHAFMTPAILYDDPYELKAHESVRLRYRSLIHTGPGDSEVLEEEFLKYQEE